MAINSQNNASRPVAYYSERAQRRAERRAARAATGGGAWIMGVVLIALGVVFILQNMGAASLQNWWALFILIPALGSFGASYAEYRANGGRLNSRVRGSMLSGFIFIAISAFFLFNLNIGLLLPILLIVAGVGMLINTVLPD